MRIWEVIFWAWLLIIVLLYFLQYLNLASLFFESYAKSYFPFLMGALA